MMKFRIVIEGENFNLTVNDVKGSYGFITTRYVEADNQLQAQEKALTFVISELKQTFEDEHN